MLQWIASAMVLLGIYYYGQRRLAGPALSAGACLLWVNIGLHAGMLALAGLNGILFIMHIRNVAKWSDEHE